MENNNIYAQWNDSGILNELQKELQEMEHNNDRKFEDVPYGEYEVSIDKISFGYSKSSGNPMVSVWFNIVHGDYKGQKIFMNQVIHKAFLIHKMNEFLRSIVAKCNQVPVIEFKNFQPQYENLLMDIHELIADQFEYGLKYSVDNKGFDTFSITDIYALED